MKKLLLSFMFAATSAGVFAQTTNPSLDMAACAKPDYPKASLMNEEQGKVQMTFVVSVDGKVIDSKLEKSSGFKNLDKQAITSFSKCKFKPGMKDGKPSQGNTLVEFAFTLD